VHQKKEAKKIAHVLIVERMAACVQILKCHSIYSWDGEICNDKECLLNIKTKKENFEKIESKIKELHSYDVPEIIQIDITNSSRDYKQFIGENTQ
jgi:periplasmic divalent cation tolerance protein